MKQSTTTTKILWAVFISLLFVLLPHTAWAFGKFEPVDSPKIKLFEIIGYTVTVSDLLSYVAAFAFEAAIAVLVHKLAEHLSDKLPKSVREGSWWWVPIKTFWHRYVNPIGIALIIVTAVSALANLAHAVQYGQELLIFTKLGVPPLVYTFAFGAILPVLSLTFARVLSSISKSEEEESPELIKARDELSKAKRELRESELRLKASEEARRITEEEKRAAEARMDTMGDLVKYLFADDKRQRIVFVKKKWPELKNSAIALITDTSEAHVSETLKQNMLVEG